MSTEKATGAPVPYHGGEADALPNLTPMSTAMGKDAHLETALADAAGNEISPDLNHVHALEIPDWELMQKKIVRRLDITLLPQLWILYMFNYLNRVNIAQARLNTFNEDLNLKDGDYQVPKTT